MLRSTPLFLVAAAVTVALVAPAAATPDEAPTTAAAPTERSVAIDAWLVAGPVDARLPAFAGSSSNGFDEKALAAFDDLRFARVDPADGDAWVGPGGEDLVWSRHERVFLPSGTTPRIAWIVSRIATDRYVEPKLALKSFHRFRAFLDGEPIASNDDLPESGAAEPKRVDATVKLAPGTHRLVIRSVFSPSGPDDWQLEGELVVAGDSDPPRITTTTTRRLSIDDLIDTEAVSNVMLSPSGMFVALEYRRPEVPADHSERWVEIRDAETARLVHSTEGLTNLASFAWRPVSFEYSYVTWANERATIWVADVEGGGPRAILRDVEKLGSYRWMPDGRSIVYSRTERGKPDDRGVKRMRGPTDRWPGRRDVSHLFQAWVEDGSWRRMTAGPLSVSLEDIRPDGRRLLFSRARQDLTVRPFAKDEVFELDLDTLNARPLFEIASSFTGARYAPDGILVFAGAGFATECGLRATFESPPNDYDGQLFLWKSKDEVRWLTESFAPAVVGAKPTARGDLVVLAEDGSYRRLYRFERELGAIEPIDAAVDAVGSFDVAELRPRVAVVGSSANVPPRVVVRDIDGTSGPRVLQVPGRKTWDRVAFGAVEDWSFESTFGDTIDGRVYLPPHFDPTERWPLIVYYYGGTSPIDRSFGGRYPKNLWAAHGYVVYTLNPSGATGYGLEFSTRHVNDWGKTTAAEIIEGTEKFLAAHPYVDPKRVGCIGASYGGFMTMLLTTRTDRFASAVSHAGISSISSYWGEGHWGHLYSAVATAESFPWNRPDIYVEQSPLFAADRVATPLLLLHGTADTNVPVGESEQMYTALKLLGKEVEFIRIDGEDHHVLTYPKRKLWMQTIVAWFDRTLKGDASWWNALYPEAD